MGPSPKDLPPKVVELTGWLVRQLRLVIPPAFELELNDAVSIFFHNQGQVEQDIDLHYAPETGKEDLANVAYQIMSTVQDVIIERTAEVWPTSDVTEVGSLALPEPRWSGNVLHLPFVYESEVILELAPLRFTEPLYKKEKKE